MKQLKVYGLTCVLTLVAALAGATTIVMPTDEQLIAKAPVIVEGTVISSTPVERDGAVWTDSVVEVARSIKGEAKKTITVRELGGMTAERYTKIFGSPEYEPGERVLLFLEQHPRGGYRTVDMFVGKFRHARAANGRRLWLRKDADQDAVLLDAEFRPIEARNAERDAAKFEKFISERLNGRKGEKDYGVENPVLENSVTDPAAGGDGVSITSEFTLIAEPTVYRWQKFDSGQTAQWYSSGTQSGYSDGGVSELRTAMGSWSGYSSANINYTYAGTRGGTLGGLSKGNGVNEVLFGDPLSEISGSFTGSGVVGQGGFNGVSGSGTWNAPFAADADHPAGPIKAYYISEGNLVIQDGVSPGRGISSSRLAEIVAHEFGHTLGFGHSADSTALMYYSVTGRGPSLRSDDQLAARWLYPNGAGEPPPPASVPAAPSSLKATVSGSNVLLAWNDNSTNESGFRVYLSSGGSFSNVADLAANSKSTTLSSLAPGSYQVYVSSWNAEGSAKSATVGFTVAGAPSAAFSVSPSSGTAGVTSFSFYDESTGSVTSRSWNFGDGATSTSAVASHVYAKAGTYTVTLTVSNAAGSSQASRSVTVTSGATAPVAAFRVSPPSGTAGVTTFTFYDDSTGTISSRSWNFGDGYTSTSATATHVYASPGTYNVILTVSGSAGSSQTSRTVSVAAPAPVTPQVSAAFDMSTSAPLAGSNVSFADRSTGSPTRWAWNFGDGSTSSQQNPVHAYASPGSYTVTLTASNAVSSSTVSRQVNVTSLAPYRTLVSAAAQTNGAGGTSWRTELTLFNAGSQSASITILFLPNVGGSVVSRNLVLGPKQSGTYYNALVDMYGIANGAGALAIEATSAGATADLRVTSRTFTSGGAGTFGQAVPDVAPEALERTLYVTGIEATGEYRTNIGLVNRASATVNATMTLYSSTGSTIASKSVTLGGNSFQQSALGAYFPEVAGGAAGTMSMKVVSTSADAVSAYASVIDNRSQDPIYIQAVPARDGSSLTLPVVSRANGANGTYWRTDVTMHNPSGTSLSLTLRYSGASKTVSLGGGDTRVLADVVTQMGFGSGTGPLQVSWSGATGPVVTSRTYTTTPAGATFGQSVDPVSSFWRQSFVTGLRNDASYRTNVGFVNGGSGTETFTVRALATSGVEIGRTTVTLAPGALVQQAAAALFPGASLSAFTLAVEGDADAKLFAYGSMVDNASGDPVFYAGH